MRRRWRGTRHLFLRRLGFCDPNRRAAGFWQPPGIRLQMHGACFAELSVMEVGVAGFLAGAYPGTAVPARACLSPVPLMREPSSTPSRLKARGVRASLAEKFVDVPPG